MKNDLEVLCHASTTFPLNWVIVSSKPFWTQILPLVTNAFLSFPFQQAAFIYAHNFHCFYSHFLFKPNILPQTALVNIISNQHIVESSGQFPNFLFFVPSATFDPTDYSLASWNNFFPRFTKHHTVLVFLLCLWLLLLSLFRLFFPLISTNKQQNASQDCLPSVIHPVSWLTTISMSMTPSICLTETFPLSHMILYSTTFSISPPWNLIDISFLVCTKLNFEYFLSILVLFHSFLSWSTCIFLIRVPLFFWLLWPGIWQRFFTPSFLSYHTSGLLGNPVAQPPK